MKKILSLILAFVVSLSLFTIPVAADDHSICYNNAAQLCDYAFQYLDDFYSTQHPEMALMNYYGTPKDQANIKQMADQIVANCTTTKEKVNALASWIKNNITYEGSSPLPSETFYSRTGNCVSYATLLQAMCVAEGIPAVFSEGHIGETEEKSFYELAGHAWCFVYVDDHWGLYDPLWGEYDLSDTSLIPRRYYIETVNGVVPVYGSFPVISLNQSIVYNGETKKTYIYHVSSPVDNIGEVALSINHDLYFRANLGASSYQYVDGREMPVFEKGEVCTNGLIEYSYRPGVYRNYYYANGIVAVDTILETNKKTFFCDNTGILGELLTDEYDMVDGNLTLKNGYVGKPLRFSYESQDDVILSFDTHSSNLLQIDEDGTFRAMGTGVANVTLTVTDKIDGGTYSERSFSINIVDSFREADFSMHQHNMTYMPAEDGNCIKYGHAEYYHCEGCERNYYDSEGLNLLPDEGFFTLIGEHDYVREDRINAGCNYWGQYAMVCSICGDIQVHDDPPLGHNYVKSVVAPSCNVKGCTLYTCSRCGDSYKENETAALSHSYTTKVVAPTCKAKGYTLHTCSNCGNSYKDNETARLAHKYVVTTKKATLSANGKITRKCSVCGTAGAVTTIYYPKTIKLSTTSYTYNGKVKNPGVTVTDSNGKTISSSNYTVTKQKGRTAVGKYSYKITFKGNYSGTKTRYFTIKPAAPSVSKLTSGSKKLTIKASTKPSAKGASKYQIAYRRSGTSKWTTVYSTTQSKTITGLTRGKKYQVRIRSYKSVDGVKYYSSWSSTKTSAAIK